MDTLAAIAIAILAVIGAWIGGQRSARKDTERRIKDAQDADKARRLEAGRAAVGHGRDSGDDPATRLRQNDGSWR